MFLLGTSAIRAFGRVRRVLQVGPDKQYTTVHAAAVDAEDDNIIEIDAGIYINDTASWTQNGLTIRGVGGIAHMQVDESISAEGKAIWVIHGDDTTVENIEGSGCRVSDLNGAPIRLEGAGLRVHNCYFHDNNNGLLAGANALSDIVVTYSEFARNGYGDGQSHNIYIGFVRSFTLKYCYSHHALIGHLVKSRAATSYILYNRLMDETDGRSSYQIDFPSGGIAFAIGNVIQQGVQNDNTALINFGTEGYLQPVNDLYVCSNTIINDDSTGQLCIVRAGADSALITNNAYSGVFTELVRGTATFTNNIQLDRDEFVDADAFDYHISTGSTVVGAAVDPGSAHGFNLLPIEEYVHPMNKRTRSLAGQLDIGSFELLDCVMSAWSFWTPTSGYSSCVDNQQSRNEHRTRTILRAASIGGAACGDTEETRITTRSCTTTQPTWRQGLTVGEIAAIPIQSLAAYDPVQSGGYGSWGSGAWGDGYYVQAADAGHQNGSGNAAFNLNILTDSPGWETLFPGTPDVLKVGYEGLPYFADGNPNSRHTYFTSHLIGNRYYMVRSNSLWPVGGFADGNVDYFDLDTNTYGRGAFMSPNVWQLMPSQAVDHRTGKVYSPWQSNNRIEQLSIYDAPNNTWSHTAPIDGGERVSEYYLCGIGVDTKRDCLWIPINPQSALGTIRRINLTGGLLDELTLNLNPGDLVDYGVNPSCVYDPIGDKYYIITAGPNVFRIDPDTGDMAFVGHMSSPISNTGMYHAAEYIEILGGIACYPYVSSTNFFFLPLV